ncbi:hypothetical protein F383_36977 [Gossypium arboreum]|uniref:Uncharacterized protein n=1 Tax=Gossypium arboreum TaxID=29729 RepID=A0A0B0M6G0_GOSAR|nr:hypothetical protein F383_36977 [Gossypium arboreum]
MPHNPNPVTDTG